MSWRDKFFPPAACIVDDADLSPLPQRAVPFIWHIAKQLRTSLIAAAIVWAAAQGIATSEAFFIGRIVGSLSGDGSSASQAIIIYICVCQVAMRLFWQLGHAFENYYMPLITMFARRRLATYLYNHSYGYFQDDMSGRLAGKVIEMPNAVSETIVDTIGTAQLIAVQAIVSTSLLVVIDGRFGLLAAGFYLFSFLHIAYRVPELEKRSSTATDVINRMRGGYIDSISNILLVKLFARSHSENERLAKEMAAAASAKTDEQKWFRVIWLGQHLLNAGLQTGIVLICYWGWKTGTLPIAAIATALTLSVQMASNIWWAITQATTYFSKFATIQDGLDTIIQPYEVADRAVVQNWQPTAGAIEIKNITFAYPPRQIFKDFSLAIPAGQKIGLVGPSGAGKSTLLQLILRLHDVEAGAITIDGQNIAEIAQDDLRSGIAMLPQQADLLHRSIADNIRYGRLEASDAAVEASAKQAEAHAFIMQLPQGYDSLVGERGVKLSGGQRQRIAIARAFIKNAPILILDEPTSALDSESEQAIQTSLATLMQDRTAIVIAHRLSTIAHLDRIVVLEAGKIVEDGTHSELLAQGGLYARLWHLQTEGFIGAAV